jgi:hypothetical protein
MHTLISFLIIFSLIFSYLILYHKIDINNFLDVMHSAFSRQFIFELIPFIILFTTRELKFIDLESSSNFFNSVIGRSMIGMIAFTFATYTLSNVNPNKINSVLTDPINTTLRLNSFTSQRPDAPTLSTDNMANHVNNSVRLSKPEHFNQRKIIEPNEKLLPYALIN